MPLQFINNQTISSAAIVIPPDPRIIEEFARMVINTRVIKTTDEDRAIWQHILTPAEFAQLQGDARPRLSATVNMMLFTAAYRYIHHPQNMEFFALPDGAKYQLNPLYSHRRSAELITGFTRPNIKPDTGLEIYAVTEIPPSSRMDSIFLDPGHIPYRTCGKVTIVFDLDETLIHTLSGNISVRPYAREILRSLRAVRDEKGNRAIEVGVWSAGDKTHVARALEILDGTRQARIDMALIDWRQLQPASRSGTASAAVSGASSRAAADVSRGAASLAAASMSPSAVGAGSVTPMHAASSADSSGVAHAGDCVRGAVPADSMRSGGMPLKNRLIQWAIARGPAWVKYPPVLKNLGLLSTYSSPFIDSSVGASSFSSYSHISNHSLSPGYSSSSNSNFSSSSLASSMPHVGTFVRMSLPLPRTAYGDNFGIELYAPLVPSPSTMPVVTEDIAIKTIEHYVNQHANKTTITSGTFDPSDVPPTRFNAAFCHAALQQLNNQPSAQHGYFQAIGAMPIPCSAIMSSAHLSGVAASTCAGASTTSTAAVAGTDSSTDSSTNASTGASAGTGARVDATTNAESGIAPHVSLCSTASTSSSHAIASGTTVAGSSVADDEYMKFAALSFVNFDVPCPPLKHVPLVSGSSTTGGDTTSAVVLPLCPAVAGSPHTPAVAGNASGSAVTLLGAQQAQTVVPSQSMLTATRQLLSVLHDVTEPLPLYNQAANPPPRLALLPAAVRAVTGCILMPFDRSETVSRVYDHVHNTGSRRFFFRFLPPASIVSSATKVATCTPSPCSAANASPSAAASMSPLRAVTDAVGGGAAGPWHKWRSVTQYVVHNGRRYAGCGITATDLEAAINDPTAVAVRPGDSTEIVTLGQIVRVLLSGGRLDARGRAVMPDGSYVMSDDDDNASSVCGAAVDDVASIAACSRDTRFIYRYENVGTSLPHVRTNNGMFVKKVLCVSFSASYFLHNGFMPDGYRVSPLEHASIHLPHQFRSGGRGGTIGIVEDSAFTTAVCGARALITNPFEAYRPLANRDSTLHYALQVITRAAQCIMHADSKQGDTNDLCDAGTPTALENLRCLAVHTSANEGRLSKESHDCAHIAGELQHIMHEAYRSALDRAVRPREIEAHLSSGSASGGGGGDALGAAASSHLPGIYSATTDAVASVRGKARALEDFFVDHPFVIVGSSSIIGGGFYASIDVANEKTVAGRLQQFRAKRVATGAGCQDPEVRKYVTAGLKRAEMINKTAIDKSSTVSGVRPARAPMRGSGVASARSDGARGASAFGMFRAVADGTLAGGAAPIAPTGSGAPPAPDASSDTTDNTTAAPRM